MSIEIFHVAFAILTVVLSFLAVELEDLFKSIIAFCLAEVSLAIYAGAVTVLFLVTLHTIGGAAEKPKMNIPAIAIALLLLAVIAFISIFALSPLTTLQHDLRPPLETYLWTYRGLDILVQAFIILAGAASVAALFRVEKSLKSMKNATSERSGEKGGNVQ
jgi:hypothetical protein